MNPYIIGIVGLSGSGKTSFLRDLQARLPAGMSAVLSQDNYYRPRAEQFCDPAGIFNFDLPTAVDRRRYVEDLQALLQGRAVVLKEYTFNHPEEEARELLVAPAPVLITEGLFVFHFEEVRQLLDLRVFVDTPAEICLERRLRRDIEVRGCVREIVLHQWQHHVLPAYEQFVLPHRDEAHLVVDNTETYEAGLEAVCRHVRDSGVLG